MYIYTIYIYIYIHNIGDLQDVRFRKEDLLKLMADREALLLLLLVVLLLLSYILLLVLLFFFFFLSLLLLLRPSSTTTSSASANISNYEVTRCYLIYHVILSYIILYHIILYCIIGEPMRGLNASSARRFLETFGQNVYFNVKRQT